jgi:alanyl-tRNA synthetase
MKDNQVLHIGVFESGSISPGMNVTVKVDSDKRLKNARLHTAGHLIFSICRKLKMPLIEKKGYHYEEGPYVEFEGILPVASYSKELIQTEINSAIHQNLKIFVEGDKERVVSIEGFLEFASGCGGTHLNSTRMLVDVVIRKIKCSKGITKISYTLG